MKFCSICGKGYYSLMYKNPYVMLLSYLTNDHKYVDLAANSNNYKIMDNSIIELGQSFSISQLVNSAILCKVNEIILPDEYKNGMITIMKIDSAIDYLKINNLIGRFKLMGVCHGSNEKEIEESFNQLNSYKYIDVIGIPKYTCQFIYNRFYFSYLFKKTKKQIHFLGVWNNIMDEFKKPLYNIRSVDTCIPYLYSLKEHLKNINEDRNGLKCSLNIFNDLDLNHYNKIINDIYNTNNFERI